MTPVFESDLRIALVGGKNCGKSALFNALTGAKAHVGNYPGVTTHLQPAPMKAEWVRVLAGMPLTARKTFTGTEEAFLSRTDTVEVIDMPGLSSLNAFSVEEATALKMIIEDPPDIFIDVIDASNIEMGLYLALQFMELNVPLVIALNMMDEVARDGVYIDVPALETALGVDVVPISATKEQGLTELMEATAAAPEKLNTTKRIDFCTGDLHKAVHSICHIIERPARAHNIPLRYAAEKLIEHDPTIPELLDISEPEDIDVIGHIVDHLESDTGLSGETVMAKERYAYVDALCAAHVKREQESQEQQRSQSIDAVLTHRIWGIPIFLGIMALVFWLTFNVIGGPCQELLEGWFEQTGTSLGDMMLGAGVSYWLYDLIINGAWAGVCSVLSFLPIILVLFFFLSILEDSGYTMRVAFVMDKLLRRVGLSGRSLAPLIVGFGCNVPAIMATRSLPSERDRKLTMLLVPFMSCSAKLPVYAMITAAFFGSRGGLVMVSLYVLGVVVAILLSLVLSRTVFKGDAMMYIVEMPNYRIPALSGVLRHTWDNAKEFVKKAFTIIFLGTIVIWFLQNFDLTFNATADSSQSILAFIGTKISFIFAPIGLDSWQATTALLAGLVAKEAIVSTLTVLMGGAMGAALSGALAGIFTPLTAYTFLAFILLYVPCIATFATTRKELNSTMAAIGIVCMQLVIAYVVCLVIYNGGLLLGLA